MKQNLSLEQISAVMDSTSEEELLDKVKRSVVSLGFDQFMIGVEVCRPLTTAVQHVASRYSENWQRIYQDRKYIQKDPTITHCQRAMSPLVWTEGMYSAQSKDLWEESRSHGLAYGVSIPVHEREGVKSMFSLARDKAIERDPRELEQMISGARVLASCTHFAITRIVVPAMLITRDPKLTRRERECLIWAAKGKTSCEIGMILYITESTVVFHLKNVMKKLNVVNRIQAIAVAVGLGLVY